MRAVYLNGAREKAQENISKKYILEKIIILSKKWVIT